MTSRSSRYPLREGLTWSDGEAFTADDVIFTDQMIRNTAGARLHEGLHRGIASMTKVDDHTVEIETTRPTPRLSVVLGSVIYGNAFYVVPEHVWEDKDPATFTNFPPVTISAYKYADHDPNGILVPVGEAGRLAEHRRRPDGRRAEAGIRAVPLLRDRRTARPGHGQRRYRHPDRHLAGKPRYPASARTTTSAPGSRTSPMPTSMTPASAASTSTPSVAPYDDPLTRWALALAIDSNGPVSRPSRG